MGRHTCWLGYFILVCLWCGRMGGRTYGHVTTKTSRMHRLSNFLTRGAPLRARKESSATKAREHISLYNQIHSLYRAARFCTVNHLSGGGVNANHNATHSPSLARKRKLRIAKEIAMMNGIFVESRSRHALFLQESRTRKIRKIFEENYSSISRNRAITSNEPWNTETKRVDRNARFTVKCVLKTRSPFERNWL